MTMILKLDLDLVKMYHHTKNVNCFNWLLVEKPNRKKAYVLTKPTFNETVPLRYGHWNMTIELVKLNNQVFFYSLYFYKLCPHLVELFSGDYFATLTSLIEEFHFEKK